MKTDYRQPDLFEPEIRARNADERTLMRALVRASQGRPEPKGAMVGKVGRMSRAAIRRLMTDLPRITVLD